MSGWGDESYVDPWGDVELPPFDALIGWADSAYGESNWGDPAYGSIEADAVLEGDATIEAKALPEDEIAVDLYGDSTTTPVASLDLRVSGSLLSEATVTAVSMLKKPIQPTQPVVPIQSNRLPGFQPGRQVPPKVDRSSTIKKR